MNDGANGIHTIVVFSDAWLETGQDYINKFLNVAFEGKTPGKYENIWWSKILYQTGKIKVNLVRLC